MKQALLLFVFLVCPLLSAGLQAQILPLPPLTGRVVDLAEILTAAEKQSLIDQLTEMQKQYSVQIAVLTVPSTQPESIEQYAVRVFEAWKLGDKGRDDGLLMVIAKNDRKVRLEVGYGVEGAIPDVVARRIIDSRLTPAFKQGKFAEGISAAIQAIGSVIDGSGEFKADAAPAASEGGDFGFIEVTFFAIMGGAFVAGISKYLGMGAGGIASTLLGLGSGLSWPLILLSAVLAAAGVAIFAGAPAMGGRGGRGGFGGGGFGGWSGGGGGGSIFSGGGGSSGGGGASGSW